MTQCPSKACSSRPQEILRLSQRRSASGKETRRTVLGGAAPYAGWLLPNNQEKRCFSVPENATEGRGELFQHQKPFLVTHSRGKVGWRMALQMFLRATRNRREPKVVLQNGGEGATDM